MNPTKPAIPRLMRRTATLVGVAPPPNAPVVTHVRTGAYRTVRRNAATREAVRVDFVRRAGK